MITVQVDVTPPYPVRIGPGALNEAHDWLPEGRIAVISDDNVAPLHAQPTVERLHAHGRDTLSITVDAGEASKSSDVWSDVHRRLARARFGRDDGVLAIGGGVVTDLAGFVAATYARGIALVHAPTSLLGMADAAIGGKTGINLPEGKNLVGAFWQPRAVLMDVDALRTLPPSVFASGTVEMFKHGMLADPMLTEAVASGRVGPQASNEDLGHWLAASAHIKASIVAADERETSGARATLNLGHTVGHALEAISGHAIDHGCAVAWGLLYAAHLSIVDARRHGRSYEAWSGACRSLIERLQPSPLPTDRWDDVMPYLARDKKNRAGRRRWVLADAPGEARLASDVDPSDERTAWTLFLDDARLLVPTTSRVAGAPQERGNA